MTVGKNGFTAESFAVIGVIDDQTPPPPPTNLAGMIYGDGTLEVTWDASEATDIRGYRVLHANQADHHFTPYLGYAMPPTIFLTKIPLMTLTRKLYIQVVTQDLAGNMSEPSEILVVDRPDVVPPPKPRILDIKSTEGNISLLWSVSPDKELSSYQVWKKEELSEEWQLFLQIPAGEVKESFLVNDHLEPTGLTYLYAVEALDSTGNSSGLTKEIPFRTVKSLMKKSPMTLSAQYDPKSFACRLQWTCNPEGDHHFVILRGVNGKEPVEYRSVDQGLRSLTDNRIEKGMKIEYSLMIYYKDGSYSMPSDKVNVDIP